MVADHNLFEGKGEPTWTRTEALPSLTPNRWLVECFFTSTETNLTAGPNGRTSFDGNAPWLWLRMDDVLLYIQVASLGLPFL